MIIALQSVSSAPRVLATSVSFGGEGLAGIKSSYKQRRKLNLSLNMNHVSQGAPESFDQPSSKLVAREVDRTASRVVEGLYVGSETVAKNEQQLRDAGITHVLNCCSRIVNFFPSSFHYLKLAMRDAAGQDVSAFAYVALEFIDDDELVEITPESIRVRKRFLLEHERKRASRGTV